MDDQPRKKRLNLARSKRGGDTAEDHVPAPVPPSATPSAPSAIPAQASTSAVSMDIVRPADEGEAPVAGAPSAAAVAADGQASAHTSATVQARLMAQDMRATQAVALAVLRDLYSDAGPWTSLPGIGEEDAAAAIAREQAHSGAPHSAAGWSRLPAWP